MRILKRMKVALLALLPLVTGMAIADTEHGYSRMFVFGASFIDPGNHFVITGETAHPPFVLFDDSYAIGGHNFSNGPTWVEILAREMELTKGAKPAYRNPAFGNYAFGYARARDVLPDPMEPSLYDQVQDWIDNGYCTGDEMHDTLFVMDSSYFDTLDVLQGEDPQIVLGGMTASIAENIGILYECGARNLLIALMPPLEKAPIVENPSGKSLSAIYNYILLMPVLGAYAGEPFNMNISTVDFYAFTTLMLETPEVFGLSNVTDSCVTFSVHKNAFCEDRDGYFWWDPVHPTRTVHALLAGFALEQLPVLD